MDLGDFTKLAKNYKNRTGYSITALNVIKNNLKQNLNTYDDSIIKVADVGAGTGKLTENLFEIGLNGFAVEPNDAMRAEGIELFKNNHSFIWSKGTAENTGLEDNSVDWVLMGSSFHWPNTELALKEFYRILKPGGFFTAIWNPRNIESSLFHKDIEQEIQKMCPDLKRVSSGSRANMQDMDKKLLSTKYFEDLFLIEAQHSVSMTKERYMGAWKSVNDIPAQVGDEKFNQVLNMIETKIKDMDNIEVPYISRAFTVKSTKK